MNQEGETIKVEWTEETGVLIGANRHPLGTTDFLSQEEYDYYCLKLGWCKNCETDETGERKPGQNQATLVVQNVTQVMG